MVACILYATCLYKIPPARPGPNTACGAAQPSRVRCACYSPSHVSRTLFRVEHPQYGSGTRSTRTHQRWNCTAFCRGMRMTCRSLTSMRWPDSLLHLYLQQMVVLFSMVLRTHWATINLFQELQEMCLNRERTLLLLHTYFGKMVTIRMDIVGRVLLYARPTPLILPMHPGTGGVSPPPNLLQYRITLITLERIAAFGGRIAGS
jgi:hypothetical protein